MATSTVTDNSYIGDFKEQDLHCLSDLNVPGDCYIDTSEDYNCLNSAAGGHIERILKNTEEIVLLPKQEVEIETQIYLSFDREIWFPTNLSLLNKICKLNAGVWLAEENRFTIREGLLSVKYTGRIKVIAYNKNCDKIIINRGTSIAWLITTMYTYTTPTLPQYKLF